MSQQFEIEKSYRLYDNTEGVCLELRPHPDGVGDGYYQLHTPDPSSKSFYGNIDLALTTEQVKKLIELLSCVVPK